MDIPEKKQTAIKTHTFVEKANSFSQLLIFVQCDVCSVYLWVCAPFLVRDPTEGIWGRSPFLPLLGSKLFNAWGPCVDSFSCIFFWYFRENSTWNLKMLGRIHKKKTHRFHEAIFKLRMFIFGGVRDKTFSASCNFGIFLKPSRTITASIGTLEASHAPRTQKNLEFRWKPKGFF